MNIDALNRRQLIWLLESREHIRPPRLHQIRKAEMRKAVVQGLASHRYGAEMRREIARMVADQTSRRAS